MKRRTITLIQYDPYDPNSLDHPSQFHELSPRRRRELLRWVAYHVEPANRVFPATSYGLKHAAEHDIGGYVPNGALKGAMLSCGHEPINSLDQNWRFRVRVTGATFKG